MDMMLGSGTVATGSEGEVLYVHVHQPPTISVHPTDDGELLLRVKFDNGTIIETYVDAFPMVAAEIREDRDVHVHEVEWKTAQEMRDYFKAQKR